MWVDEDGTLWTALAAFANHQQILGGANVVVPVALRAATGLINIAPEDADAGDVCTPTSALLLGTGSQESGGMPLSLIHI